MREHAREEFARLWEVWPNQTERRDSEREYIKARTAKNSTMPPIDDLLGIAREHVRRGVKEALKWWIRGARWEDKFPDDTAPVQDITAGLPPEVLAKLQERNRTP